MNRVDLYDNSIPMKDIELYKQRMNSTKEAMGTSVKSMRKIGSGGYGSIYSNDSKSVLKIVCKKEEQASQVKSLLNEIAIYKYLLKTKTKHILQPYEYIDNETVLGISLQRGHISLNEYLKRHRQGIVELINGGQSVFCNQFLYILREVMIALQQLNSSGVIHCDIKPQNIMLSFGLFGELNLFLIDFGLSQLTDDTLSNIKNSKQLQILSNTSKTAVKGTDTLVDPQMIWNQEISPYCDLWSLGIMILQLLVLQDFKFLEIKCLQKMKSLANKEIIVDTIIQKQISTIINPQIKHIISQLLQTKKDSRSCHKQVLQSLQKYITQAIGSKYELPRPVIAFPSIIAENIPVIRTIDTLVLDSLTDNTNTELMASSIQKNRDSQKISVFNISDHIVVQNKKKDAVIVLTLQGEVYFNNNAFFTNVADRLKGICERYSFPTKLKQRIVSYWNVLKKQQSSFVHMQANSNDKRQLLIYLHMQYLQAPQYQQTAEVYLSFNTTSKIHIITEPSLIEHIKPKYASMTHSQIVQQLKKDPIPITIYQDLKMSAQLSNQAISYDLLEQFAFLIGNVITPDSKLI